MIDTNRFSPGESVFVVLRDESKEPVVVERCVSLACVGGVVLAAPSINGRSELDFILGYLMSCTRYDEELNMVAVPVEDCYTTKSAAKEAMQNERDCCG